MRPFCLMLLGLCSLAGEWVGECWAGPIVVFSDGRSLEVASVDRKGGAAILHFIDGGAMRVPESRIENWDAIAGFVPPPPIPVVPAGQAEPAWRDSAGVFAELIGDAARRHAVDPALLTAMVHVESAFDPRAVSPKGAQGLLQLMPATSDRFGVQDPFDARQNVEGGAAYLSWLIDRFDGEIELALAGYNAGEGNVDRHRGIPPYPETVAYVQRVLISAAGFKE